MDWIQGIQRAIDYVETNITEEIDFEAAAKEAHSSSFHFQRVFGILCGFSLGEYIRMRRLSLAGDSSRRERQKSSMSRSNTDMIRRKAFSAPLPASTELRRAKSSATANAIQDITALWRECGADGTIERLAARLPQNAVMKGLLGICFSAEIDAKQFPLRHRCGICGRRG